MRLSLGCGLVLTLTRISIFWSVALFADARTIASFVEKYVPTELLHHYPNRQDWPPAEASCRTLVTYSISLPIVIEIQCSPLQSIFLFILKLF